MGRHWLWNGRPGALGLVKKLAAHMDDVSLFASLSLTKQPIEPGVAVGMNGASIAREMIDRVLALAVHAELVPGTGRSRPTPGALIAHVAPESGGFGLCRVRPHLQLYGGVVCKQGWPRPDQFADVFGQRLQQGRCASDPVAERGAMQIDPLARVDPGLPLQRQTIAIIADQHVRHEAGTGAAAFDQARG